MQWLSFFAVDGASEPHTVDKFGQYAAWINLNREISSLAYSGIDLWLHSYMDTTC